MVGQVTQVFVPMFDELFIDIIRWLFTRVIARVFDEMFIEINYWVGTQVIAPVFDRMLFEIIAVVMVYAYAEI